MNSSHNIFFIDFIHLVISMVLNILNKLKKRNQMKKTLLDQVKSKNEVIDKEPLKLRIESLIENNILENKHSSRENSYFIREKVPDLPVDNEQQNAPFRNPATPEQKDID